MSGSVFSIWRRLRPLIHPVGERDDLAPTDLERGVAAAMPVDLGGRVAIPPVFLEALALMGSRPHASQRIEWDFTLYAVGSILRELALDARVFHDDPELVRRAGAWLRFGKKRSHGDLFLCVDTTRADFGKVAEGYDSHPWLNETFAFDAPEDFVTAGGASS